MSEAQTQENQRFTLGFLLFSFEGRIGNIAYTLGVILLTIAMLALIGLGFATAEGLSRVSGYGPMGPPKHFGFNPFLVGMWFYALILILTAFVSKLAMAVKRAHDIGVSGAWILIGLIPYVNILVLLWLVFWPGTQGANTYGVRRQ